MSNVERVLAILVDPVTIIVVGAVVLLVAVRVKEWHDLRIINVMNKSYNLSEAMIYLRFHERIGARAYDRCPERSNHQSFDSENWLDTIRLS